MARKKKTDDVMNQMYNVLNNIESRGNVKIKVYNNTSYYYKLYKAIKKGEIRLCINKLFFLIYFIWKYISRNFYVSSIKCRLIKLIT